MGFDGVFGGRRAIRAEVRRMRGVCGGRRARRARRARRRRGFDGRSINSVKYTRGI